MIWLPDTNVWIRLLSPLPSPVKARMHGHNPSALALCSVVVGELYYGAYKSQRREENLALVDQLIRQFPLIPFDSRAARHFGEIHADLARKGKPIGPYDLQIAAIALANDYTLVTHNVGGFSRVPGLRMEDWEE
jgi:tRNA(fMet)-specific endonuclease VapC